LCRRAREEEGKKAGHYGIEKGVRRAGKKVVPEGDACASELTTRKLAPMDHRGIRRPGNYRTQEAASKKARSYHKKVYQYHQDFYWDREVSY